MHTALQYAHIGFPSGRETTVPLRDVAPVGGAASGTSRDAKPGPALDTQVATSRDPFDGHPSHLQSKHLPKRLCAGLMIKTPATLGRTTSVRVKLAMGYCDAPPSQHRRSTCQWKHV